VGCVSVLWDLEGIGEGVELSLKTDLDDLHGTDDHDGFGGSGGETSCVGGRKSERSARERRASGTKEKREREDDDHEPINTLPAPIFPSSPAIKPL